MLSRFLSSLAAAFLAVLMSVSVSAGSERMRVRVAYAGFGAGTIVTSIARDKHFFAKYGLDLDAVYLDRAATGGVQSLLGIDIFVSSEDVLPALEAAGEGADLVFFGGHVRPENYRFGVASYVDHLAQLKGKKVGVSNLGRKSDLIARVALRRAGLDPVKDVEMVPIGFSPQRMAAIYRNIVQGAPLVPQVAAEARRVGIKVLDIGQVDLVNDLLVTSRSFADRNPDALRRFLMAYLNGVQHFLTQRADSMRVMKEHVTLPRGTSLREAYNWLAHGLEPLPLPHAEALQALIDAVSVTDPRARELDPRRLLELDPLGQLERAGFIKGLYSEKIEL